MGTGGSEAGQLWPAYVGGAFGHSYGGRQHDVTRLAFAYPAHLNALAGFGAELLAGLGRNVQATPVASGCKLSDLGSNLDDFPVRRPNASLYHSQCVPRPITVMAGRAARKSLLALNNPTLFNVTI